MLRGEPYAVFVKRALHLAASAGAGSAGGKLANRGRLRGCRHARSEKQCGGYQDRMASETGRHRTERERADEHAKQASAKHRSEAGFSDAQLLNGRRRRVTDGLYVATIHDQTGATEHHHE
jgi:hypothetical protein